MKQRKIKKQKSFREYSERYVLKAVKNLEGYSGKLINDFSHSNTSPEEFHIKKKTLNSSNEKPEPKRTELNLNNFENPKELKERLKPKLKGISILDALVNKIWNKLIGQPIGKPIEINLDDLVDKNNTGMRNNKKADVFVNNKSNSKERTLKKNPSKNNEDKKSFLDRLKSKFLGESVNTAMTIEDLKEKLNQLKTDVKFNIDQDKNILTMKVSVGNDKKTNTNREAIKLILDFFKDKYNVTLEEFVEGCFVYDESFRVGKISGNSKDYETFVVKVLNQIKEELRKSKRNPNKEKIASNLSALNDNDELDVDFVKELLKNGKPSINKDNFTLHENEVFFINGFVSGTKIDFQFRTGKEITG